jgi:hypothetical protein
MKIAKFAGVLIMGAALMSACDKKPTTSASAPPSQSAGTATALPATLILTSMPVNAKPVEEQKAAAKVGDTIAISGRVGGSEEPFLEDRALLTLMGPGLPSCADNPGDACAKPWDYCCEKRADIVKHSATVRVVGPDGKPVKVGLKGQGGMKELSKLVVVGKVSQLDENMMVVDATGIYVEKQ